MLAVSFSFSNWLDMAATAFVVVGVAGEIWAFIMKLPFNPTNFPFLESKKKSVEKWSLIILGIGVFLELTALPKNLSDVSNANRIAGEANERASTNELQVEGLKSNNFALEKEVIELRNPNMITAEQREKFIEILCEPHNTSKIPIIVILGGNDRQAEKFAFQVRKILDEAGYGFVPSKYQLPFIPLPDNSIYVTDAVPHIDLPAFEWRDAAPIKMKSGSVSPLPDISNSRSAMSIDSRNIANTEQPFTDKEPNVIALFSGDIPPISILPSVNVAYPTPDNPYRGFSYMYSPTKDPNAILYGVCEVFHELGITVGKNKVTGMAPDGFVVFFIPSR